MNNGIKNMFGKKLVSLVSAVFILFSLSSCVDEATMCAIMGDCKAGGDSCITFGEVFAGTWDATKNKYVTGSLIRMDYIDTNGITQTAGVMGWITGTMRTILTDTVAGIYNNIAGNDSFVRVIKLAMILAIAFFGIGLLVGIVDTSPWTALMLMLKVTLVWLFITEYNKLFEPYVMDFFENLITGISEAMVRVFTTGGTAPTEVSSMDGLDDLLSTFFNWNFLKVIMALLVSGMSGIFYAFLLAGLMLIFLMAAVEVLKVLALSMIARFLLYALGPIFIAFALFGQTRSIFDGWVEQLINFTLQPIFIFTFLGLFTVIMQGFLGAVFSNINAKVCYEVLWNFFNNIFPAFYWWRIKDASDVMLDSWVKYDVPIPVDMWSVLAMIILAYLMKNMTSWAVGVAGRLSSGFVLTTNVPLQGWSSLRARGQQAAHTIGGGARGALFGSKDKKGNKVPGVAQSVAAGFREGEGSRGGRVGQALWRGLTSATFDVKKDAGGKWYNRHVKWGAGTWGAREGWVMRSSTVRNEDMKNLFGIPSSSGGSSGGGGGGSDARKLLDKAKGVKKDIKEKGVRRAATEDLKGAKDEAKKAGSTMWEAYKKESAAARGIGWIASQAAERINNERNKVKKEDKKGTENYEGRNATAYMKDKGKGVKREKGRDGAPIGFNPDDNKKT